MGGGTKRIVYSCLTVIMLLIYPQIFVKLTFDGGQSVHPITRNRPPNPIQCNLQLADSRGLLTSNVYERVHKTLQMNDLIAYSVIKQIALGGADDAE